ncbi:mitochondrial ribosomal protein subunit L20-domain-containing protein [Trametes punicea]|nr:mitochondrial ribosomal protein subunit L20-domain-containing protein [Trametes punicea]
MPRPEEVDLPKRARGTSAMSHRHSVTQRSTTASVSRDEVLYGPAMKPRLPLSLRLPFASRSYVTRLPERPPYRAPDPLVNNPRATYQELPDNNLTFIHRPPPTAPSPLSYTTNPASPLLKNSTSASASAPGTTTADALPPAVRKDKGEKPRLSDEDIAKLRDLRRADPVKWTRGRLAKEFNCTPWFVGKLITLRGPDRRRALEERERAHAAARAQWGERKSLQADVRKKRREFW